MYTLVLATILICGLSAEEIPLIQMQDDQSNFYGLAKGSPHSKNARMGTSIYDYSFLRDPEVKPVMEQNTEGPPSKEVFGSLFMPQVNDSLLKVPFLGFDQNQNVAGSSMQQQTSASNGIELFMGQTQNLFNPNLFAQNQQTQQKQQPESNFQNQLNANQMNQILTILSKQQSQNHQAATPNYSNILNSMLMAGHSNKNGQQSIGNLNYGQTVGLNGDFTFGQTWSAPKTFDLTSISSHNTEKTKSSENKKIHLDVTDLLSKIAAQSDIQTNYKFASDEEKPIVIKLDKPRIEISDSPKFEFDDYFKRLEKTEIANSGSKFSEFPSRRPTLHKTSSYESYDFSKIPTESYETKFHDYLHRPSLHHIEDSRVHKDVTEYKFPLEFKKPKIEHHHVFESKLPESKFNFEEHKFSPKFVHKGHKFPPQFSGESKFGHNFDAIRFDESLGGKFEKESRYNKVGNRQKQQPPKFKPKMNAPPKKISPPAKYLIKITKH